MQISNRLWQKSDNIKMEKHEQHAVKAAAVSAGLFSGACIACFFFGIKGIALRTDRLEMFGMDVAALFIFFFLLFLAFASVVFAGKAIVRLISFLRDKRTSDRRAPFFLKDSVPFAELFSLSACVCIFL